jgi:predicted membrane channel-forming protein YqfA (hemolysin III family)
MALAFDRRGDGDGGGGGEPAGPSAAREHDKVLARELEELLAEIRVVLPGVSVLFAFLLTLPFTASFGATSTLDRAVYFVAFLAAAAAMILLVAPSAYHRLGGKPYDKALLLRTATRQAIGAVALLAASITAVVFLVTDMLFARAVALATATATLTGATAAWFVLPLVRRARRRRLVVPG